MRAKCIDAAYRSLTLGKEYEVSPLNDDQYVLTDNGGECITVNTERFEVTPQSNYQALKDAIAILKSHGYTQFSYPDFCSFHEKTKVLNRCFPNEARKLELQKIIDDATKELEAL